VSSSNKVLIADLAVEKIEALKKKEKLKKIQKDKAENIKKNIKEKTIDKESNHDNNDSNQPDSELIQEDKDKQIGNEKKIQENDLLNSEAESNPKSNQIKSTKLGRGARQREKKKLLKSKLEKDEITAEEYNISTKSKLDLKDLKERRDSQKIKHGGEKNDKRRLDSIKQASRTQHKDDDSGNDDDEDSDDSNDIIETDH